MPPIKPNAADRRHVLLAMDLAQSPERRTGIARYALEQGWVLDWRVAAFMVQGREREYVATTRVDGVISMMTRQAPALQRLVSAVRVPVVDLWHDFPEVGCARVLLDQRAIGRAGAEHLLERGLRRLLFYSHTVDSRVASVRWEGFARAAEERNVAARDLWWDPDTPLPPGQTRVGWLGEQLRASGAPLGVMAVNDAVATEVLDAAATAGLNVPEDVAVVGADNDPILSELGSVPLSSVDIGRERLGYDAARLLHRLMDGTVAPLGPTLVAPTGVVTRRSTDVIAVDDPNVARAARYIRDRFRDPITVADVAAATFLGRRRLQDLFRAALGRSMNDEILRHRLRLAQHLLATTPHKMDKIARQSGFGAGMRLSKVFRREVGMTPQQYRRKHRKPPAR